MPAILAAAVLLSLSAACFRRRASGAGAAADRRHPAARRARPAPVEQRGHHRRPAARRDRAARAGGDRGEEAARGRRARRPRRSDSLSEGDRQPRARACGRADDGRHHLRSGVADQGRGHDDERDDARRAGPDPAERSRGVLHAGLRALRQGRHHGPPPADPRVGVAARRRSGGAVGRVRDGDRARGRRGADVASGRALRLQRHQLLPPRRHRAARQRPAARSLRARARLRAAGDEGHDVQPAGVRRVPDRADGELHAPWLALSGARHGDAAGRGARSDGAPDGRRGRACGPLQHGRRPGDLLPDAARRGRVSGHARSSRRSRSRR